MQSRILFLALGASLLGGQSAIAQDASEKKLYVDLGYSLLGEGLFGPDDEFDVELGAISGHVGYEFSKHWSIEGEAMIGVENDKRGYTTTDIDTISDLRVEGELDRLLGVYLKRDLPVSKNLNIFGRVGATALEVDASARFVSIDLETDETTTQSYSDSDYEYGGAVGLGMTYDLTDKLFLRSDLTVIFMHEWEMHNANLGIGVRF